MKSKSVSFSQIASHPFGSLSAEEHLGSPDHVKKLLKEGSDNARIRLRWMIEAGVVTKEQMDQYVTEIMNDALAPVHKMIERVDSFYREVVE